MEKIVNDQTEQLTNLINSDAGITASKNTKHNGDEEHQYRYFYVKLNTSGKISSTSSNLDLKNPQISEIISKASVSKKLKGTIEVSKETFRFTKTVENSKETIIVFINTHIEHEMLDNLLIVLILSGLCGLLLVFFGSLYVANRSLIPIKESWNRQKDFVANASHELRTPLSVIETTIDLLINKKKQTIGSQMKWLENIRTENKSMTKLVSDLLFLARADSDQNSLELKTFPLHSALLEAYIPFEAVALQKGIYLQDFNGEQIDFLGDESKIRQLAVIFIDNAIKYTPAGGQVGMTLVNNVDHVEISISDTGEGIAEEHINKIFQRFYRVDKARSRKEGCVGLGLSIAEWIVKQHHGHIKIESTKEKGSTFCIILPK